MHKITSITSILVLTLFLLSSCSPRLSPFTQRLYEDNQWSDSELKRIQFYLSDDIVLRRQVNTGKSEIVSGEIKIVDGQKVEEIRIRKGTPGVFIFRPKEQRFAVSFESKGNDKYLIFGPSNRSSRYTLRAKEWRKNRQGGKVTYDGKVYYTSSESAYATLLVDLKKVRKVNKKTRVAKGRTVN